MVLLLAVSSVFCQGFSSMSMLNILDQSGEYSCVDLPCWHQCCGDSVPGPSAQYANAVTDGADVFICKDKCHRALIKRVTHSQARTLRHF